MKMTAPEYTLTKEEKRFQKYHHRLMRETMIARAHLKLWERLENYKSDYLGELNQARHFFTFTTGAHLDDTLLILSRILDKRGRDAPLTIWTFLNFAEQNLEIFSTPAFKKRVGHKAHYDDFWIQEHTPITRKEINEDRKKLTEVESTISKLMTWRDKVIAHIDRRFLIGESISKKYPLQYQELQRVVNTLAEILNRYSRAYESLQYYEGFPNEDDVQLIMDCIRFYIQEHNK